MLIDLKEERLLMYSKSVYTEQKYLFYVTFNILQNQNALQDDLGQCDGYITLQM